MLNGWGREGSWSWHRPVGGCWNASFTHDCCRRWLPTNGSNDCHNKSPRLDKSSSLGSIKLQLIRPLSFPLLHSPTLPLSFTAARPRRRQRQQHQQSDRERDCCSPLCPTMMWTCIWMACSIWVAMHCHAHCPDQCHAHCDHHTQGVWAVPPPAPFLLLCCSNPSSSPMPHCHNVPMPLLPASRCHIRPASSALPPADPTLPPVMPAAMANPSAPPNPIRRPICSPDANQSPCWTPTYLAGRCCVCSSSISNSSSAISISSHVQCSDTRWPTPCPAWGSSSATLSSKLHPSTVESWRSHCPRMRGRAQGWTRLSYQFCPGSRSRRRLLCIVPMHFYRYIA